MKNTAIARIGITYADAEKRVIRLAHEYANIQELHPHLHDALHDTHTKIVEAYEDIAQAMIDVDELEGRDPSFVYEDGVYRLTPAGEREAQAVGRQHPELVDLVDQVKSA